MTATDRAAALELARKVAAIDGANDAPILDPNNLIIRDLSVALLAAEAERERLARKLERVIGITQNLTDDVQDHSRYLSTRGKGGQQVSPCHTFASMPPSALSVVGRYARELRLATSDAEVTLAATTDTERHDG